VNGFEEIAPIISAEGVTSAGVTSAGVYGLSSRSWTSGSGPSRQNRVRRYDGGECNGSIPKSNKLVMLLVTPARLELVRKHHVLCAVSYFVLLNKR